MAYPLLPSLPAMPSAIRLLVVTILATCAAAHGGSFDNFPPLPGWTRPTAFTPSDSPLHHGILLDAPAVLLPSPLVAEIDGNPSDGL